VEQVIRIISDYRQWIMPAIILPALCALVYVIVDLFRDVDKEIDA